MEICIECNKRPVSIKKRKLCSTCYSALRKAGEDFTPDGNSRQTRTKYANVREVEFIKNYFNHKNWVHHPASFHIDNDSYSPDFYDGETNTFIEVAGTRQAYHFNKQKYDLFHKIYPLIKLEVRTPDGELLQENNGRLIWDKTTDY